MSAADDLSGGDIGISIVGRPPETLTIKPLGMKPYILVIVDDIGLDDDSDVEFRIEVGGGIPLDTEEIALVLEGLADALRTGEVQTSADDTPTQEPLA